jgi:histidinol-phosphatase (PHP family)
MSWGNTPSSAVTFLDRKAGLVDYHVHSTFSYDGRSTINEICERAVELKFREVGFSEHVDFDPSDEGFGFFDGNRYESSINEAQRLFNGKLAIRMGVEVDYQSRFEQQIRDWLRGKRFDFVIGSVHYVDGEIIGNRLVAKRSLREVYGEYFAEVRKSVESRLFDVVGHLDVVNKYVSDQTFQLKDREYGMNLDSTLKEIIDKEIFLEVNTKPSVLENNPCSTLPNREAILRYFDFGGKRISVGSDTHVKEELGSGINEILGFLERNGPRDIVLLF